MTQGGRGRDKSRYNNQQQAKPQGDHRYLYAGRGRQGGANGCGKRCQKQARDAGCRDKRQRLVSAGCD